MEICPWGTRGSIPSPGPSTVRYGGNTSCVEVRLRDGTLIIIDAGSGIRPLGAAYGPCEATLLLSHYHWDHIQGLPFFLSAYSSESSIHVYGGEFNDLKPDEILAEQMYTPFFPAAPSQLRGITRYHSMPAEPFEIGDATVRVTRLSHPGITYGFRIEEAGTVFVYMSDNEVDLAEPALLRGIIELASGADLLLHDCQYTELEYPSRQGFGHSTPRQAVRLATEADVSRLMIFHHDPMHSDEQVEAQAEEACRLAGGLEVIIGCEGETVGLGERVSASEIA